MCRQLHVARLPTTGQGRPRRGRRARNPQHGRNDRFRMRLPAARQLENPVGKAINTPNIRASVRDDLDQVVDLMQRVFQVPPTTPYLRPEVVSWKYWDPRDDWREPRSYVAEQAGRIVAHLGIWPVSVKVGESTLRGAHLIDWAADRDAAGVGTAMFRRLRQQLDFMYSTGGTPRARRILELQGFKEVAPNWKAARPLRPWPLALRHSRRDWRWPARLIRNVAWASKAVRDAGDWSYEPADPSELPTDTPYLGQIPRDPAFFRYMARCPAGRCRSYRLLQSGRPKGSFMLMKVRHHARFALWLQTPSAEDRERACAMALRAAMEDTDAVELAYMGSSAQAAQAADAAGFRIRGHSKVTFYARNPLARQLASETAVQLCDLDAIFYDDGGDLILC